MNVLYDYQIFFTQKNGGISRYHCELVNSLHPYVKSHMAVKYHKNIYLSSSIPLTSFPKDCHSYFGGRSFPGKGIFCKCKELLFPFSHPKDENQKHVLNQLALVRPEVFHPTYYDDYFLNYLQEVPFVLTIHDMIHEIFPELFPGDNTQFKKKKLVSRASHIIAISESTKKDIMDIYGCPEEKISVIHLASSFEVGKHEPSYSYKVSKRYLLFVGERRDYKNFLFFISSIVELLKREHDLSVICTGRPFNKKELIFFDSLGIADKVKHMFVSDRELISLYQNAEAFIFPSLYEGFGLPVLEAFSCGCPALLSDASSLPEVGGDAAMYFNPKSNLQIIAAVDKILHERTIRKEMVNNGYKQLKLFSWDRVARETAEVYRKCIAT